MKFLELSSVDSLRDLSQMIWLWVPLDPEIHIPKQNTLFENAKPLIWGLCRTGGNSIVPQEPLQIWFTNFEEESLESRSNFLHSSAHCTNYLLLPNSCPLFFFRGLNHTLCLSIRTTEHFVQTEKNKALMEALFVDRSVSTLWAAIWDLYVFQTSHLHQKAASFCEPELSFAEFIYLFGHSTLSIYVENNLVRSFFGFDFVKYLL